MKAWTRSFLFGYLLPLVAHAGGLPDGVLGLPKPRIQKDSETRQTYIYPEALVTVASQDADAGEEIAIYRKTATNTPSPENLLLRIPNDSANYFAGLAGDAVFVVSQTGPDGSLYIHSLSRKKQVFADGFREPARVRGKFVELEKLIKGGLTSLSPEERNAYPKVAKLVDQGLSAGWFQKVRINLDTYSEEVIGHPVLHEMQ